LSQRYPGRTSSPSHLKGHCHRGLATLSLLFHGLCASLLARLSLRWIIPSHSACCEFLPRRFTFPSHYYPIDSTSISTFVYIFLTNTIPHLLIPLSLSHVFACFYRQYCSPPLSHTALATKIVRRGRRGLPLCFLSDRLWVFP
jgi:hypothetical protein